MEELRSIVSRFKANLSSREIRRDARRYFDQFQETVQILNKYLRNSESAKILDVGCGRDFPHTFLFHHSGYHVVGIDIGLERGPLGINLQSTKRLIWLVRKKMLHGYLANHLKGRKSSANIRLVNTSVAQLSLQDNSFDAAISVGVWEHIQDVESASREIARVLVLGGIVKADGHLFTSISGSHHPLLSRPPLTSIPSGIKPWYHLRDPDHVSYEWVNKVRLGEYRRCFHAQFQELSMVRYEEGKEYLTEEIRKELSDYTVEELTTRSFQFVGRNSKS